jgi:hypothetical protein
MLHREIWWLESNVSDVILSQQRSGHISLNAKSNPEDGGSTTSETLAFNCQITRNNTPKTTTFISFAENLKLL